MFSWHAGACKFFIKTLQVIEFYEKFELLTALTQLCVANFKLIIS